MPIRQKNRPSTEFSLASISDIVFLLLIFFMITSSFVQPGVKVELPQSSSEKPSEGGNTVTVTENGDFFWGREQVDEIELEYRIQEAIEKADALQDKNGRIITLRTDNETAMKHAAVVISAVAEFGGAVVIATKRKS